MERKLFIIRHAKSSWEHNGLDDIDRPLAERGIRNAGEMAKRLLAENLVPQLILTSPANRALNTALIMSKIWGLDPENLQVHEALYDAHISEIETGYIWRFCRNHKAGHFWPQSLFYILSQPLP